MPSKVTSGGTGAPTAAGARINLGLGPNNAVSFASLTLSGNLNVSGTATFGAASFTSFTVPDGGLSITGSSDATKILKFEVDGFTTGTTRTVTIPNASTTMVGTDTVQTLTNKSIGALQLTGTIHSDRLSGSYTGVTGVGPLNAGSIISGFGSINIGTDSLTAGAGSLSSLSLTSPLTVANGGTGVATITGLVSGNGTSVFVGRTITGTANEITVTNGSGATANPTLSLPAALTFTGKTVTGGTFNSTFNGTIGATTPNTGAFTTIAGTALTITANATPLATLVRSGSTINSVLAFTNDSGTVYIGHGAANTFAIDDDTNIASGPWFSIDATTATFSTALTTTGAFTSIGIDDNATGERLQLADTILTLGTTGELFNVVKPANDAGLVLSGGTAFNTGAAIILRGGSTGISQDNDIVFLSNGSTVYRYDASEAEHQFSSSLVVFTGDAGTLQLGAAGANIHFDDSDDLWSIWGTGLGGDPLVTIDATGVVSVASGIEFPATQVASSNANTLDDYEEGTFTPVVTGSTTAGTGTYTTQTGKYTKIGNVVHFNIILNVTAHTGTGNMTITGMPFAASESVVIPIEPGNMALTANNIATALLTGSTIALRQTPVGGGAVTNVAMDSVFVARLTGFYFV